jgi:subtilisin family serine protease
MAKEGTGSGGGSKKGAGGASRKRVTKGSRGSRASSAGAVERENRERIQRTLSKSVVALPLLDKLNQDFNAATQPPAAFEVIVDAHLDFPRGRKAAREWILAVLNELLKRRGAAEARAKLDSDKNRDQTQYVFATITGEVLRELVYLDTLSNQALAKEKFAKKEVADSWPDTTPAPRAIYQIWEDFEVFPLIFGSISTVKADAARAAFKAAGTEVVWAVVDSGIAKDHPHFERRRNLVGDVEAWHRDFTGAKDPLVDDFGHGTHVAGIIAGEMPEPESSAVPPSTAFDVRDAEPMNERIIAYQRTLRADSAEGGKEVSLERVRLRSISGMAPFTKLVSLRVLDGNGRGHVSNIIAALSHVQEINAYGRRIRIHGVNLSVGYPFDPEWFACGQSQLCVEVDRLVRSGVAVVVAAGNTGYGTLSTDALGARKAGMALTINDPGNAQLAITVGSTHRTMPHVYGVSYFSAKGPTGDGRMKPDLLAPGEKVLSCATGKIRGDLKVKLGDTSVEPNYAEYTGTSMAAPHVSGCVAAFLSVKREFIGQPERVKEIFLKTATDLGREPSFQGRGLVDLMRAIQFV